MKPYLYLIPLLLLSFMLKVWGDEPPWWVQVTTDYYGKSVDGQSEVEVHTWSAQHKKGNKIISEDCGDTQKACTEFVKEKNGEVPHEKIPWQVDITTRAQ